MQQNTPEPDMRITLSIVSHCHGHEVERLVEQALEEILVARIILTLNLPETLKLPCDERLVVIENTDVKGFGANHNAAFIHCSTPYFCVLNPDIVLLRGSFDELVRCLQSTKSALAGPLVISPDGRQEDSWRRFPTLRSLFLKALGRDTTRVRPQNASSPLFPDWIAGMCMLFDSAIYSRIRGFDERLFLYYEDVDVCARLWRAGHLVVASPRATLIHNAQRASHYNWKHMRWHAVSMFKYFWRYWLRLPKQAGRKNRSVLPIN
jgi:N-acetylglucosaminyl-diphospho-decaprenol L-rhamnosyltransferase